MLSQDALIILQHCGLAVHQERRAMQVALRSGPVKAAPVMHQHGRKECLAKNRGKKKQNGW